MKQPNGSDDRRESGIPGATEATGEPSRPAREPSLGGARQAPDRRRCIWCALELRDHDSSGLPFAPSVCVACAEYLAADERLSVEEFIERLPHPVLVLESDGVVVAANEEARAFVGKGPEQISGRRGGDVIECSSARLPGGCGNTIHCKGCALRRSVLHTFETGEGLSDVVAHQSVMSELGIRRMWYRLATERVGQLVLVRIDDVGFEREA